MSAARVRHAIAEALEAAGTEDADVFDATVIASELVGNAVRHAPPLPPGQLRVEWSLRGGEFRIAVTDGGTVLRPLLASAKRVDVSGRGLAIVAAIASDWGISAEPGRTTVWAQAHLPSAASAARQPSSVRAAG